MKEDFLHYIWRYLKFDYKNLKTTDNQSVKIWSQGEYLQQQGPDFFNAKLEIDGQIWAGNVEIHIKSSDWYLHNHQEDTNYQNVILHVVWTDDVPVINLNGVPIPTIELHEKVDKNLIKNYKKHFDFQSSIPCSNQVHEVEKDRITLFLNQLILKKLELKSIEIEHELEESNRHWEALFLKKLFHYFGSNINGNSFEHYIKNIPFHVFQKTRQSTEQLHALFYGFMNILPENSDDFVEQLKKEYQYIKHLYQLSMVAYPISYFKLRPDNFPTIRISQFVEFVHKHPSLFFELIEIKTLKDYYSFFDTKAHPYWKDKYVFGKTSTKISPKKMSKTFINLLLINVVLPFKYAYFKNKNEKNVDEIIEIYEQLEVEKNHIIEKFPSTVFTKQNALHSQAILHLYNQYCTKKQCMKCTIGNLLLRQKK